MSLNMYLGESDTQTKSMNANCIEIIQSMEQVMNSIDSFTGAMLLQGKTYKTAKIYMSVTFRPLAQGFIYLCEELIRQNDKYPNDFRLQVATTDVVELEIVEQIQEINRLKKRMEVLNENLSFLGPLILIYETMKRKLQEKLIRLHEFNTTSSSNYYIALELAHSVAQGLAQVQGGNGFNSKTGTFSMKGMELGWITRLDEIHYKIKAEEKYGEYLKNHPEAIEKIITIIKYEEKHRKYIEQTDEFLSPLEERDIIEIKYLMYTAEEPYRTLSMKYLDRFEIAETKAEPNSGDEGVFRPAENAIFLSMDKTRIDSRGNYYTFFHEIAHAVDYYYGQDNGIKKEEYFTDTFILNNKTLTNHIKQDVRNNLNVELTNELRLSKYDHINAKEKEEMIDNVKENILKQNENYGGLIPEEKELQHTLRSIYKGKLNGADNNTASDIFGGVTNNVIRGDYHHGKTYWFNKDGTRKREPNAECFAEYFGRIMVPESESKDAGLDSIKKLLPLSKEFMDKVLELMNRGDNT